MKVYKKNNQFFMEDNGVIAELTPDKWYYLHLPTNSVNRQCVSCAKVDKAPNQCVDYGNEVKIPRVLGPYTEPRKMLEEYMTDEERSKIDELTKQIESIKEVARQRRIEATKKQPLTEKEKLEREIAKYEAKLAALKNKQAQ